MPIVLTKDDKFNLVKIAALYIIVEVILICISFPIYNYFKDIQYVILLLGFIAPIFLGSSISYLMFKYKNYMKIYNELSIFVLLASVIIGIYVISFILKLPAGSPELGIPVILMIISYAVFTWISNKIILIVANRYIKMTAPITNILIANTLIFRIDERNKENKINSLLIFLKEIYGFRQIKTILNQRLLINNNTGTYIHILLHQNTLLITPFKNSIYEFDFNVSDIRQSINDLSISLLNYERIEEGRDEESKNAVAYYIRNFTDFSVKKYEIKDIFPVAKIITIVVAVVVAIILLFLFYPSIPGFFQYLQDIGATAIIIGTIIGGIILTMVGYSWKFLQKRFFKK